MSPFTEVAIPTDVRYAIAEYLRVPNEHIRIVQRIDNIIWFHVASAGFSAEITKTGKYKKHSVRSWV